MIKKVFFLVLLILFFLPSLVSAISGLPPSYNPQTNLQKTVNDYNNKFAIDQMNRNMQRDIQQHNYDETQKIFGGSGGGSGNYATSAPTGPAPNADELIAQMNEELTLAKSYADAADRDLLKINNRNSVENLQVSIFGGNTDTANSIEQNLLQSNSACGRVNELISKCNCNDRIQSISKETYSIQISMINKLNQAEAERENKGMVGEIMKTISNSQKGRF
jgi:hypothetical protein